MQQNPAQFQQPMAATMQVPFLPMNAIPQCVNTGTIMSMLTSYWWVIVALVLAFLYYRQQQNKDKKKSSNSADASV